RRRCGTRLPHILQFPLPAAGVHAARYGSPSHAFCARNPFCLSRPSKLVIPSGGLRLLQTAARCPRPAFRTGIEGSWQPASFTRSGASRAPQVSPARKGWETPHQKREHRRCGTRPPRILSFPLAPLQNLSSRPERPDFLFRAVFWRVGPRGAFCAPRALRRGGGICFSPPVASATFPNFRCTLMND